MRKCATPAPLQRAFDFVESIGLPIAWHAGAAGFVDHIRIQDGSLLVDERCEASTLLHEAGHLAITPGRFRPLMNDNVSAGINAMMAQIQALDLHPDDPLYRAAIQCSDPEATAWAWAAGAAIGLPPKTVIQDHEYDCTGDAVRFQLMASLKATTRVTGHPGIHGLAHAGMCALRAGTALPMYPKLVNWLQAH